MGLPETLTALRRKRGYVKARQTRIKTFVESFDSNLHSEYDLTTRLEILKECWQDFNVIQTEITAITEDDKDDVELNELISFEENYYILQAKINTLIANQKSPSSTPKTSPVSHQSDPSDNIKLPDIPLPSFSGKFEEWTNFYDVFLSMIHNSSKLSKIQKFYYLRSCLSDEALRCIKEIKVSAENYDSAWTLLQQRFKNERLIIKAHVLGIINYKQIDKPTASNLRSLYDTITNHLTALKNLGETVDQWGTLLVFLIVKKLDVDTREQWESFHAKHAKTNENSDDPLCSNSQSTPYSFKMLLNFLQQQCNIHEVREEQNAHNFRKSTYKDTPVKFKSTSTITKSNCHTVNTTKQNCMICKQDHSTFMCKQLADMNTSQRHTTIRKLNLCLNCLKSGHKTIQCKSPHSCKQCQKRHHTLLHFNNFESNVKQTATTPDIPATTQNATIVGCSNANEETILATAIILIEDLQGTYFPCRALLDSGSQSNFISHSLTSALGIQQNKIQTNISGIGNAGVSVKYSVRTRIKSRFSNFSDELDFLVLRKITNDLPASSINSELCIPTNIHLADEEFFKSRGVDLLLGANIFYQILHNGQIKLGDKLPVLQNTEFGWVASGTVKSNNPAKITRSLLTTLKSNSEESMDELISSFWKIEEFSCKPKSIEEQACEDHFIANVKRQEDGKFIVKLPFSSEPTITLGSSKDQALKRFLSLERRLSRDPKLKQAYINFLNEYFENDELESVSNEEIGYYMPHHPIIKHSSSTTPVRVVFDASARTDNGTSLNDILMIGPTIQRDLLSILLSFRTFAFVFTSDIKQMYRKILVNEDQRDFQRILWRDNPSAPIQTFRLKTVTYGTASAPFLAIRTLFHLGELEKENFPAAAEVLHRDFYVDDVLTGGESLEEVIDLQTQLIEILKSAGFELRKWCANHPSILENIPIEHVEASYDIESSENKTVKTLGVCWNPSTDTFHFKINLSNLPNLVTKRIILADISRIFDPTGFVTPVVVAAKLIMQDIWQIKNLGWDESVPENIFQKWNHYRNSLNALNQLSIDRRVLTGERNQKFELHGFSDASEKAYGACLYVRTIQDNGVVTVKLLCSKSRVAPLKTISLPRLELCGALLLAQLLQRVRDALAINFSSVTLWSDSTIVLQWLNAPPKTWQTFVCNRVAQIQNLTKNCVWKHVRSSDNSADLISRSCSPEFLISSNLWWHGPHWLSVNESEWPEPVQITAISPEIEERRNKTVTSLTCTSEFCLPDRYSSWSKLLRITALCQRFINNCHNPTNKKTGHITSDDLVRSELFWLKQAQQEFKEDIDKLKKGKEVSNKLKTLVPFIDNQNLIRVGGRLKHALIDLDYKNPILLPQDHLITRLIFNETHLKTLHAGPQALLSTIRTKYWPISGKILARSTVRKCFKCSRTSPRVINHLMGDLPSYRVQPAPPFSNCGIDFCGPFYYRRVSQRRSQPVKAYAALFICMATKAIHLELVPDLTTTKFLEALERMISRRGKMKNIYSDNATNFLGARNELKELHQLFSLESHQHLIHKFCASEGITWHFIPPRSPHFGGIWEAGVKSVKGHLKRVLGSNIITYDQLETLFVKIEACVNSRPIVQLSTDPNDFIALTPAHFLIGKPISSFPVPDLTTLNPNTLNHWQRVQQMYQHFWRRWTDEYLSTLQQRNKWSKDYEPPKVGSLVLLKDEFRPPLQWPLGRIIELHHGADNKPRVATVKTERGVFKRALRKLCALPEA